MPKKALYKSGQKVDDFRLDCHLGGGQDGEVWQATRLSIDRKCVIKFLNSATDSEKTERFSREIKILSHLQHPHIVSIEAKGEAWNPTTQQIAPYYVMEHVSGRPIKATLEGLPPQERLEALCILFWQVLSALRAAHSKAVCHGDIKSANILVVQEPLTAKLSDFGFALLAHQRSSRKVYPGSSYKAPKGLGPIEADIYRLGMTLKDCVGCLSGGISDTEREALSGLVAKLTAAPPTISVADAMGCLKKLQVVVGLPFTEMKTSVWDTLTKGDMSEGIEGMLVGEAEYGNVRDLDTINIGSSEVLPQALRFALPYLCLYDFYVTPVQAKLSLTTGRQDYAAFHRRALPLMMNLFASDPDSVRFICAMERFLSYIVTTQYRYLLCLSKRGLVRDNAACRSFIRQEEKTITLNRIAENNRILCLIDGSAFDSRSFLVVQDRLRSSSVSFSAVLLRSLRYAIATSQQAYVQLSHVYELCAPLSEVISPSRAKIVGEYMAALQHLARGVTLRCLAERHTDTREIYASILHLRTAVLSIRKGIIATAMRNPSAWGVDEALTRRVLLTRQWEVVECTKQPTESWQVYSGIVDELIGTRARAVREEPSLEYEQED